MSAEIEKTTDELQLLLEVLPQHIRKQLKSNMNYHSLIEIVLDLGRYPQARFESSMEDLSTDQVTQDDIGYVLSHIGEFSEDNRAGIERTLHRISAIRNRTGSIIGLTCRAGRAVYGTGEIIRDVIEEGKSLLLLGRPGVGKTTLLREAARVLADDLGKRVIIVDTSNEIGGDGDIPHPGIGRARRMQVPRPNRQHAVMIEAVENHMPQVIVIDEIGTEAEAAAARTIAERGVQLIATAHGNSLENLLQNPTLMDLVGGVQAVTLSDEEARRRGTQKTVLERKAPSTFNVMIEIQDRGRLAVHHNVGEVVDGFLRGTPLQPEIRTRAEDGKIEIIQGDTSQPDPLIGPPAISQAAGITRKRSRRRTVRVFSYGISRLRLERVIQKFRVPVVLVSEIEKADLILTLKSQEKRQPHSIRDADVPRHLLKSNTTTQMEHFLRSIFPPEFMSDGEEAALQEAEVAAGAVREQGRAVELSPQNSHVRRLQHLMAERFGLQSESIGREPNRRVIFRAEESRF